jgi:hypothetical protein
MPGIHPKYYSQEWLSSFPCNIILQNVAMLSQHSLFQSQYCYSSLTIFTSNPAT